MTRVFTNALFIAVLLGCHSPKGEKIIGQHSQTDSIATVDTASNIPSKPGFEPPDGWTEIESHHIGFHLDLRYATTDNFVGDQMYPCGRCYLRTDVARQLWRVKNALSPLGYELVLYDCYRPRPVQQQLWDKVPDARYVTPPKRGSMHNRGAAIDLGLTDMDGQILDMGTAFDFFGKEAYREYMGHSPEINARRQLLRQTMEDNGFRSIRTEWWHYSLDDAAYELADWEWTCD